MQQPEPDLQANIEMWKGILKDENTNELTSAILATVIFVAKKLQQERALLLPHVARVPLESYSHTHEAENIDLELRDGMQSEVFIQVAHAPTDNIPGATYELQVCYQKLGTLLNPKHSDLFKSLSLALHE